jgi:hypothetical protein
VDGRKYGIACSQIDIGNATTEMTERPTRGVTRANGTIAMSIHDVDGDQDAPGRSRLMHRLRFGIAGSI